MTAFDIDHDGYLELNEQLYMYVRQLGDILTNLNASLKNIEVATQGKATPVWQEAQTTWTGTYTDMETKLNAQSLGSINAQEIFGEGDLRGQGIMLG
ncbi:hypothetical protein V5P93_002773 [Actinokineospora auranticolor]|uniref:Uncharacterized protein n=1 Tax=Actinokineospora auranticolor TaxID=155976 RepID=A0A2S6H0A4_9PSEU|nr:hypothetical protein [Actinokineospora auranticolor]PPK70914.1 hypothetical protein CLV40_101100 [Actinokineospora auranticolor]